MGFESPLYESRVYTPINTVLSQQRANPMNSITNTTPLPDLASIPTNQVSPLTQAQQQLLNSQQQNLAQSLVQGRSPSTLQEIATKGGVYTQAALAEMSRQGFTPRITSPVSSKPASATNPPIASQTGQATATRAPVASSPLANGLIGTAGAFGGEKIGSQLGGELGGAIGQATGAGLAVGAVTANPVAGLATAGLSLAGSAALKGADALGGALALALLPDPKAAAALSRAEEKYQQALANQGRGRSGNDLGQNFGNKSVASGDPTFPTPQMIDRLIGGVAGYELLRNDNVWVLIGSRYWTKADIEAAVFFPNDQAAIAGGHTLQNGLIDTYFKAIRLAGSSEPLANGISDSNTSSEYFKSTDTRPDPNYFPYLPTIKVSERAASAFAPPPTFKETDPPPSIQFAPTPTPSQNSGNNTVSNTGGTALTSPRPSGAPTSNNSATQTNPVGVVVNFSQGDINTTQNPSSNLLSAPTVFGSPRETSSNSASGTRVLETVAPKGETLSNSPDPNSTTKPSANQMDLERPLNPPPPQPQPQPQQNTQPQPNNQTRQILVAIAALTGGVVGGNALLNYIRELNEQINSQTKPQAQQANAKQGVCDAMQPQQCGYEGVKQATTEATDPIKQTATANNGLLQALQTALSALTAFLTSNIGKILDLLNRQVVDRVLAITTFAMTLHNALMLSQGIGDTVGGIVDNILNLTGLSFKNSEGATVGAGEVIGANFRNFMISVIGEANYTTLSTTFAQANRIYQAGMNIVNNVQSILDSAASVAQSTGINVAKIGNALRDNHVVSPKEYGHMDDSAIGNRPTKLSRFQQLTTTISDADTNLQNFASITGSVVSIKDSVKQSKDDIKNFNDAREANSQANQEAKEAIQQQIKELKPLTEITIAKREEDN